METMLRKRKVKGNAEKLKVSWAKTDVLCVFLLGIVFFSLDVLERPFRTRFSLIATHDLLARGP